MLRRNFESVDMNRVSVFKLFWLWIPAAGEGGLWPLAVCFCCVTHVYEMVWTLNGISENFILINCSDFVIVMYVGFDLY